MSVYITWIYACAAARRSASQKICKPGVAWSCPCVVATCLHVHVYVGQNIYGQCGGLDICIINLNYTALLDQYCAQMKSSEVAPAESACKFLINCSADLCVAMT